eukprot:6484411-Amphidinium_carterae.1
MAVAISRSRKPPAPTLASLCMANIPTCSQLLPHAYDHGPVRLSMLMHLNASTRRYFLGKYLRAWYGCVSMQCVDS